MQDYTIPRMLYEAGIHCLWSIQPISNLGSILRNGILSHEQTAQQGIGHLDIANPDVNARRVPRRRVFVTGWYFSPHEYVPLYMTDDTAMLYVCIRDHGEEITLLEVDLEASAVEKSLYTNRNLSILGVETEIFDDPKYQHRVDWEIILEGDSSNSYDKPKKMAEVLVPIRVDPKFINAIHVLQLCNEETIVKLKSILRENGREDITICKDLCREGVIR